MAKGTVRVFHSATTRIDFRECGSRLRFRVPSPANPAESALRRRYHKTQTPRPQDRGMQAEIRKCQAQASMSPRSLSIFAVDPVFADSGCFWR